MNPKDIDFAQLVGKRNRAKKDELLDLVRGNTAEALASDEVWGFTLAADVGGGFGYMKISYGCLFDTGLNLTFEARVAGACSGLVGGWAGRGEMNVPPESLIGTDSDVQLIITPFALETTFWARPSKFQGVCGGGGFAIAGCAGGGSGRWLKV
ncbi:hypothetical protein [Caulobacter sp. 1776]|uniref:hypothetical protein n=1 Tax=Caulobacter sp. 1776 TaxID=3156420 RepID=UPI00339395B1